MKKLLLIAIILFVPFFDLAAHPDGLQIMYITPTKIQQPKKYKIHLVLRNLVKIKKDDMPVHFEVEYSISKYDEYESGWDHKKTLTIDKHTKLTLDREEFAIELTTHELDTLYEYLIGAHIKTFKIGDDKYEGNVYFQHINGESTNTGVYSIDSPSPIDSNTAEGLYVTIKNYGHKPCKSVYLRWSISGTDQSEIITPDDTTTKQAFPKYKSWKESFRNINPPIRPGDYRQIKVSGSAYHSQVINIATHRPNGQPDYAGDDTARCYYGNHLLGQYTIASDTLVPAQFRSIKEAIGAMYTRGFHSYNPGGDTIMGFGGGVSFLIREGEYEGSLDFHNEVPEISQANRLSFSTFTKDSTKYIVKGDSGKSFVLRLNNMHHFAISGLNYINRGGDHCVQLNGKCHHFLLSRSNFYCQKTNSTDEKQSVVYTDGHLDSCNILGCSFINGSYGVSYHGAPSGTMSIAGVSHCTFLEQSNAAISFNHHDRCFITANTLYNNRIEILNSDNPAIVKNIIYNTESDPARKGIAYPSGQPFAGIALQNCSGNIAFTRNNICVKNSTDYGLHMKNCINDSQQPTVINKSSIQSEYRGIFLDNCKNITINDLSVDLPTSKSNEKAAIFINNTDHIVFSRSAFNSSKGGYAVIMNSKPNNFFAVRSNYYSTGGTFARVGGNDFSALDAWRDHFNLNSHNRSTNMDPQFYGDCDLIVCNQDASGGYGKCNIVDAPGHKFPAHQSENVETSAGLGWTDDEEEYSYWLQMGTGKDFYGLIYKNDLPLINNSLVFEDRYISGSEISVSGLDHNTKYYWRVRVYDSSARSDWSDVFSFTTKQLTTAIEELPDNSNGRLAIRPNPAEPESVIYFEPENASHAEIGLLSSNGIQMASHNIIIPQAGPAEIGISELIDINSLPSGMYMVYARTASKYYIEKMLIIK